jgi:predicted nucleic acid-binding protein
LTDIGSTEAATPAATWLFDACLGPGRNHGLISAVTVAELLVRPFRAGPSALATAEGFLQFFGELAIAEVTYAIAREAAAIRARTGLSMPDALVVATSLDRSAPIIATNDRRWPTAVASLRLPVRVVVLGDHAAR